MDEQKQIPRALVIGTMAVVATMVIGTCMLIVFVFNLPLIFPPPGKTPVAFNMPTLAPTLPPITEPAPTSTITPLPTETPALTPATPLPTLPPTALPPTLPPSRITATAPPAPGPAITNTPIPTLAPTATLAPLPGHIVFVNDGEGTSSIYVMRADGSGQTPLVPPQGNVHDYAPALSPDGSLLAFSSNRDRHDSDDIYVMRTDGTRIQRITSTRRGKNASASWFPDNQHLAFTSNRNGKWQVYTMEADGDNVRQVTKSDEGARSVRVSPDGSRLAYTCGNDICLINRDSTNQHVLLHSDQRKDQLAWSPDATMLAYAESTPGSDMTSLHIVDRGGHDRVLVQDGAWPTWSPDGTRLVFTSGMSGTQGLYVYILSSGEVQRLPNSPSASQGLAWMGH